MFNFSSKLFRINSLLIFIFLNPLLSHASIKSTGHEIISLRNKISAIAPQVEAEKQRYFKKIDNLKSRYGPRIDELEKQISELIVEKEATRKELENGEYCSQCKRSKSKIERETKKAFHLHLTEVNGVAMPMTPLEIIVEMKKYDDKIEKLRGQLHKLKQALHKAQIAAHDYTDEILLTLELAFKNTKQKLLALAKKFRLEKTEYVVSKAVEDQKWLAGWNLRLQRLNIRARYKGKRALSMVKQLENQALQASNQVDQFDVLDQIKNKIADVQSQYQQDKQSIATLIDRASNQFEKEKLSRIDKRKQSEKDINRLITQVGIGIGVDTLHTLDVSTNSMVGNLSTANVGWLS